MNRLPALVLALLLGGCATYSLVAANARVDLGNGLSVQPTRAWNQLPVQSDSHISTWTMDGPLLDRLIFVRGVPAGSAIVKDQKDKEPMPVFRAGMSANEVMELFEATLVRSSTTNIIVKSSGLRPAKFAGRDGFRFDFTFVDQGDDVDRRGFAAGAVAGNRLYLIIYHGPRIHYFQKNAEEAEAILRSALIAGSNA